MRHVKIIIFFFIINNIAYTQEVSYEKELESLYNKAYEHLYVHRDSCYYYFSQIEKIATQKKDWVNVLEALISSNRNAGEFYDLNTMKSNLAILDSLFKTKKYYIDSLPDKRLIVNSYLYDKGNYHFKSNDFENARVAFNTIKDSLEILPITNMNSDLVDLLSAAYSFLAKMNTEEGQYDLAKQFYEKNIRFLQKESPDDLGTLNTNYGLLAEVYGKEQQYQKSIVLFKKALEKYLIHNTSINGIISTSHSIAANYITLSKIDSAQKYTKLAENYLGKAPHFWSQHHRIKAKLFATKLEMNEALNELNSALILDQIKRNHKQNSSTAIIYNEIGNLNSDFENYANALENYELGLTQLQDNSTNGSLRLKILKNKSIALNKVETLDYYVLSLETVDTGLAVLDKLKPSISSIRDKLETFEDAFPLFESGMQATYNLFTTSENDHYIDEAFRIAEKSKSVLLLEAILTSKATKFGNIPKDILERENNLKSEITYLEKQIAVSENLEEGIEDQLFSLKQELRNLVVDIETNYPAYYDLKYNNKIQTLPEVQSKLTENELFISYFYGNQNIYTIAISKDDKFFHSIKITDELENHISELHAMLSNSKSNIDSLTKLSHQLYKKLLGSILELHPQEKIILAPDGLLNYIPFGSLVSNETERRYLIEDRTISYVNSATLWSQLNNKEQNSANLLAFAPSFDTNIPSDGTRSQVLGNLPHNRNEVQQILTSFTGKSFINDQATLQNFTATLPDYSVLHLATHAVFDDKNPEYSYLAFTPKSESDDLLFVKDLYNLTLNASLVTLSGCESGIGELKRGEGFLSLARGFFYSGAASISSTLWKVNDNSSSELMGEFYENLANGKPKDASLRDAKLSFLQKNKENGLAHPYYWSGYIIQGNTEPLITSSHWQWYAFAVIAVLLIFLSRKRLVQLFK
ncbi:CHAT domain-containing protein [Maribacter forsetii]|uniref:CHAT domain-containing protein n=1 Tax=Maribacter forsetii TaxID=444515 RepID=UPI00056A34D6|nr:CHAT domain-containing protein [Maribacter forsetii]